MRVLRGRRWVAALVAFELLALWYFVRHAPAPESRKQDPQLRLRQSVANSARRCLPPLNRDARFVRRGECVTTAMRSAALADVVFELSQAFATARVAFWLDSGSLLGQQRAEGVIPWDANADVGVLRAGIDALRVTNVQLPAGYELDIGSSAQTAGRFVERAHGFYANIIVFDEEEEADGRKMLATAPDATWSRCEHCEAEEVEGGGAERLKRLRVPRDWVFPLRTCTFERFQTACPAQPEKYLRHLYGDDYLDPVAW